MPSQDGYTTCLNIKQLYNRCNIENVPIFVGCSGYPSQQVLPNYFEEYLEKPIMKDELARLVKKYFLYS
jgi:CheY-like chemotaxis protein